MKIQDIQQQLRQKKKLLLNDYYLTSIQVKAAYIMFQMNIHHIAD